MKKVLSLVLAMLMVLSVFAVTSFAAATPEISQIVSTFKGAVITWAPVEDAVAYIVYRDGDVIGTTVECQFTDTDVVDGQTYFYRLASQDKNSELSEMTDVFEVVYSMPYCDHADKKLVIDYKATVFAPGSSHYHCDTCGYDSAPSVIKQLVPASPVINYLSNGINGLKVAWNQVDGATSYLLYRRAGGESEFKLLGELKGTSYEDKAVKSGVYYKYVVRAKNAAGLSKYIGGKVLRYVATPTNIVPANTEGGIYVKWNAVANATSYRVYRKQAGDAQWTYLKTVTANNYFDRAVEPGVDYIYTVRALAGGIYSNFLAGSKIRRLEIAELNTVKSAKEGIYVDFEPVEGASGYYVYRKTSGNWTSNSYLGVIKTTKSHTYLDNSAKKGVTYTYTVKAFYSDGKTTSVAAYETKGISCKDLY